MDRIDFSRTPLRAVHNPSPRAHRRCSHPRVHHLHRATCVTNFDLIVRLDGRYVASRFFIMGKRKDRARTAAASDARRKKAAGVEAGMTEPVVRTASLQISPCDALRSSSPPYVDHVRATAAQVIAEDEHGAADEPATRARMAQCEAAQVSRMMEPCVSRHVAHTVVAILIVGWCASSRGCCARYNSMRSFR